ncbi:MAG: hypothetical protein OXM58_03075 [Rhodospirillaceae bacterium]|nr:hypothetical protein [Rhodospirillaceae bacterium]MDE0619464.1 hypothetical protein [Rhodospirillaceae bacterium]
MSDGQVILSICTILAIILGPIFAVLVTRYVDKQRASETRKMDIFRTLMRTRKMPIHFEHVGALNLIEIEFANETRIISAWKKYLQNLSENPPQALSGSELQAFEKKRDSLLTKLIYEIATSLDFRVEQLDILEGNYLPQGWDDDAREQKLARQGLIEVLQGRRPLVVQPYTHQTTQSPFPPPPEIPRAEQD